MKIKILIFLLFIPQLVSAYYVNHPCCSRFQACGWWGSADYLYVSRTKRFYPPLVTTNPTVPPIIGVPGTTILFGGGKLDTRPKSGFSGELGIWISRCIAIGLSGYGLDDDKKNFSISGDALGQPIFGQPFIRIPGEIPDVNLISFPGPPTRLQDAYISIDTHNHIWGFDLFAGYRFLDMCGFKFNLLGGFLYNKLQDNIVVSTGRTSVSLILPPPPNTRTLVGDKIGAKNDFYSGLVGFIAEWRSCSWAIRILGKAGIGSMQKEVALKGETIVFDTFNSVISTTDSGFLVQPSNRGVHTSNKWETIAQISGNVQLKFWNHFWATVGYTYMYWPAVALAGENIDLRINPTPVGQPSPIFREKLSKFWVQGLTAGLYVCY